MPDFDTSVPHSARVYDYWLGGKDNFAADREAAERALEAYPSLVFAVRANRAFLARAVRYLVAEAGIRQFLDIGTGIPTASNTHEVAQQAAPDCRIVYVDNDAVVLSHARALLTSTPEGACAYVDADLGEPDTILAAAAETLDFARPVAVLLLSVLHLVPDDAQAGRIVARLMAECVPGSFLTISHPASDIDAEQTAEATRRLNQAQVAPAKMRDREAVARLFTGLDLVPPGLVRVPRWRPGSEEEAASPAALWAGVARKPPEFALDNNQNGDVGVSADAMAAK
jgi:O-methyltransferase involved in polyketide biosynthesis